MKIIVAESVDRYNKTGQNTLDIIKSCPRMWMKADSALLTHGKPMFKPDFTSEMSGVPYLALRISRMGKSIASRFAHRYYDAIGVAVDFTAEDVLRQLKKEGEPWEKAKSFDGSVCMGAWQELGDANNLTGIEISLSVNGDERSTAVVDNLLEEVGRVIEGVSRFFTIRQGDILLYGKPADKALVEVNDHITGLLNGQVLTEFNIK